MSLLGLFSGAFCQDEAQQKKRDFRFADHEVASAEVQPVGPAPIMRYGQSAPGVELPTNTWATGGYANESRPREEKPPAVSKPSPAKPKSAGPRRYGEDPKPQTPQEHERSVPSNSRQQQPPGMPPDMGMDVQGMPPPSWTGVSSARDSGQARDRPGMPGGNANPPMLERASNPADTTIGRGFTAQLKRGLAEAAPREDQPDRPEMVPQVEGGFIATIQRGFEGIFGHLATSKEEVLKQRGLMPASEYEAVPGDDIDIQVQNLSRKLPQHLGECLKIYRMARGEYEMELVEDRPPEKVKLVWHSWVRPDGVPMREVFAQPLDADEGDGENRKAPLEPLDQYLYHCANVAFNLENGHAAVVQVPNDMRMSFADARGTALIDSDGDAKIAAMELATSQAKLREQAALEWRKSSKDRTRASTRESMPSVESMDSTLEPTPAMSSSAVPSEGHGLSRDISTNDIAAHEMLRAAVPGVSMPQQPSRQSHQLQMQQVPPEAYGQYQQQQQQQQQQQHIQHWQQAAPLQAVSVPGWGAPPPKMQVQMGQPAMYSQQLPARATFPMAVPHASIMSYAGGVPGVPVR